MDKVRQYERNFYSSKKISKKNRRLNKALHPLQSDFPIDHDFIINTSSPNNPNFSLHH